MYDIVFYEDKNGYSELYESLLELAKNSETNKDARIQFNQLTLYFELLKKQGTRLPNNITKHLEDDIWELRPGNNKFFISISITTFSFYCICSERRVKKRRDRKSKKQKENAMIINQETEVVNNENLGRFQK